MAEDRIHELSARLSALEAIYTNYVAWAALIVAVLTIGIAILAVVNFFYLKRIARQKAKSVAKLVAERSANTYLQAELPDIIAQHMELARIAANAPGDCVASKVDGDDDERY